MVVSNFPHRTFKLKFGAVAFQVVFEFELHGRPQLSSSHSSHPTLSVTKSMFNRLFVLLHSFFISGYNGWRTVNALHATCAVPLRPTPAWAIKIARKRAVFTCEVRSSTSDFPNPMLALYSDDLEPKSYSPFTSNNLKLTMM